MLSAISLSTSVPNSSSIASTSAPTSHRHKHSSNSTLKFLSKTGKLDEALRLVESSTNELDVESYSLLLHACIYSKSLEHGQRLHLKLQNRNLINNPTLKSKLITLYSVCGCVDSARLVFEGGLEDSNESESVWVSMAIGYSRNGYPKEALLLYSDMLHQSFQLSNFAFSMALKACTDLFDLRIGKAIHAQIVKSNQEPDQVVNNTLLRLYGECGCLDDVLKVFGFMPQRNVVSWNSFIASFVKQEENFESLNAFRRMQIERIKFSWITLTIILPVCARMTALLRGKEIHAQIMKSAKRPDVLVQNSLMDMYAKCGAIEYCYRVFGLMRSKDLTSWNTMLTGYAMNGQMEEAIGLFHEMLNSGSGPDDVTFIALLSGCSHVGLTDYGQRLFNKMKLDYGVSPTLEHYACLVDILGRSGRIEEALEITRDMPMKPSGSILGSLLNSCRLYGNVSVAEIIANDLFEFEPDNAGNYIMLSNIYANAGMWESVKKVRETMEGKGMKKEVGCSWIQIKSRMHTFVSGGGFKFRNSAEFNRVWNELMDAMENIGYVPDTSVVLHDVNEETKATWVCGHSERLATVYALIHTASGMPVRITKNLRVCVDCHSWMKFVSRISGRTIVLRDTNRFHHFKDGACSCKDYW